MTTTAPTNAIEGMHLSAARSLGLSVTSKVKLQSFLFMTDSVLAVLCTKIFEAT